MDNNLKFDGFNSAVYWSVNLSIKWHRQEHEKVSVPRTYIYIQRQIPPKNWPDRMLNLKGDSAYRAEIDIAV